MAFLPQDFADDTEFERFVLTSLGAHRIRPAPGGNFDMRGRAQGAVIELSGIASVGARRVEEFKASLRVLGFGTAYKVLDLLVEYVLRENGAPSKHLDFKDKRKRIGKQQGALPVPFDAHREYWDRLAALYGAFLDARHGLIHRMGGATSSSDLKYRTNTGSTAVVPNSEVTAFMAAVHGAAELTIQGSTERRTLRILAWHLNALRARHGLPDLAADDPSAGVGRIVADLAVLEDGRMRIDVRRLRGTVEGQQQRSTWDLELHGDGRVFVGSWEDVTNQGAEAFDFDPALPPSWLTEQPGLS